MKTAYSYIRFSSKKQAGGDSLARQVASTAEYCAKKGLVLDERLRLKDLGVSAFKGKNLEEGGSLARFLDAVREGAVAPGSALIVESLDRLSRQAPRRAISLLTQILDAGIEVHLTATDKVFLPENEDGIDLIMTVAETMRAHDESAKKSLRLKSAFAAKRKKAEAGEKVRVQGMLPWWLELAPDKSVVCPDEKAALLKRIFEMMAAGASSIKISRSLNAEPGNPRVWVPSTICRLIKSDAPLGVLKTPVLKIEGYYPAIISPDLAGEARAMLEKNNLTEMGRPPKPDRLPNILKGVLQHAKTNSPLWLQWKQFKSKLTGYYLARDTACNPLCRFNADQVEGVLLSALAELKPEETQLEKPVGNLKQKRLEAKLSALGIGTKNLVKFLEFDLPSVVERLVELEVEKKALAAELEKVKREAPSAFEPGILEAAKGFEMADLRNPKRREELAIALRKLVSKIQIACRLEDLGITKEDDKLFRHVLFEGEPNIVNLTPERGRIELAMMITFRTGAKRLIWHQNHGRPIGWAIFSLRID